MDRELVGMKFSRLLVIERVPVPENLKSTAKFWRCLCDCGRETNVATCCWRCNEGKMDEDQRVFLSWIERVYNHIIKKG